MSDDALPQSEDPFVVFGVAPDITDRELKKRYFALIRQFAPETHPEEFSRVQAAWEQIKDPAAREHLRDGPYPHVSEPYRTRLRDALTLLNEGQTEFARTQLKTVVEENPGLNEAHFLLGQLELNEGNFLTAEQAFRTLHEREPANLAYWQRLAQALTRLERYDEAEQLANHWLKTYPKEPAAWRVLGDALVGQKHHDVALVRLKEAIALIAPDGKFPFELALHRIGFGRWVMRYALAEDLDQLIAAAGADEDIRRQLTSDFTALAALYFDRDRPDDANLLLRRARELSGRTEGFVFPVTITRYVEELPAASIEWLKEEVKTPHIHNLRFSGFGKDFAIALVATLCLAVSGSLGFTATTPYDEIGVWMLFVFLGGLAAWAAWAWHRVSWSWRSPLARMTVLHPLFLLEVDYEKITAWSLVTYTAGDVFHHSNNGAYTTSELQLRFGGISKSINVRGMEAAVDFVNLIGGWSKRSLELLHGGVLEAEQGVDFFPAALLDPAFKSPLTRRRKWESVRRYAVAAAVAAAITAVVSAATDVKSRQAVLTAAVANQEPGAILRFLSDHPGDPLNQQVAEWRRLQIERSIGQMVAEATPADPGRENLALLKASLLAEPSRKLPVILKLKFDEGGVDPLAKKGWRVPQPNQLTALAARIGPSLIIPALEQGADPRVLEALTFDPSPHLPGRMLTLLLTARWKQPGIRQVSPAGKVDYPSLSLDGTVSFTAGQLREFPVEVSLTREELGGLSSDPGDSAVIDRQLAALLVKLAPVVLTQLGLSPESSTAR